MIQAKQGDRVRVHYTGKLEDGSIFDSSVGRDPLQFLIGSGQVIPGFEEVVIGMSPGESRSEAVPLEKAYGPHRPELTVEVERSQVPPDINPAIGQKLELQHPGGGATRVTVTSVSDNKIVLDANHPLAGKDLNFEIELVEIVEGAK